MAKLSTADAVEVTRMAALKLAQPIAKISQSGRIQPLRDGATNLEITIGGKSIMIPVEVTGASETPKVDFIRDVNPVLSKLGCNQGTCHGAKDGKVGFKLSLRGYDPLFDVRALKDDLAGRRLNVASPDDSLMLLKATGGVPHEGGQRTKLGEKSYEIMRAWIADGAKLEFTAPRVAKIHLFPVNPVVQNIGAKQQIRVVATYTDGSTRDVTAASFLESGNGDVAKTDEQVTGLIETLRFDQGGAEPVIRGEGKRLGLVVDERVLDRCGALK